MVESDFSQQDPIMYSSRGSMHQGAYASRGRGQLKEMESCKGCACTDFNVRDGASFCVVRSYQASAAKGARDLLLSSRSSRHFFLQTVAKEL